MNKTRIILPLIILLAFFVGLGNPLYDHPIALSVADEFEGQRVALNILQTRTLIQNSYLPPLWAWVQIPAIIISILALKISGIFPTLDSLRQTVIFNEGFLLPFSRLLSAFISSLSIIWIYKISRKIISGKFALIISFLFSLSYFRVEMAHFGRVNSLFMFFSLGSLFFSLDLWQKFSKKSWYLSLFMAVLASLTYLAGIFLFPFLLVLLVLTKNVHAVLNKRTLARSLMIISLISLYLLSSSIFTSKNLNHLPFLSKNSHVATNLFVQFHTLVWSELPLVILGLIGVIPFYRRFPGFTLTIFLFSLFPSILHLVIIDSGMPRYSMMLVFLPLFASTFWLWEKFNHRKIWFFLTVLLMFILISRYNFLTFQPGTLSSAKNWVMNNIPDTSSIVSSSNYMGIAPNLAARQTIAVINPSYHQSQAQIIKAYPNLKFPTKNIFYISDLLSNYSPVNVKNFLNNQSIDYLIVIYEMYSEPQVTYSFVNPSSMKLVYTVKPSSSNIYASPTDILSPYIDLFSLNKFGPNIDIYKR